MEEDVRYCLCGNVKIIQTNPSQIILTFPSLVEIRQTADSLQTASMEQEGPRLLLHCNSCDLDIVSLTGVSSLQDLDNATNVTLLNTIDENALHSHPEWSDVFQLVVPPSSQTDIDSQPATDLLPEIQKLLDPAVDQKRLKTQSEITEFTARKRAEFKSWKDWTQKQAYQLSLKLRQRPSLPSSTSSSTSPYFGSSTSSISLKAALPIPQNGKSLSSTSSTASSDLFQKSPVTQYSHHGASPLAAASLTRSQTPPTPTPSPPPPVQQQRARTSSIPLSSSLKSPSSANSAKPVKRVMFQDPPAETEEPPTTPQTYLQSPMSLQANPPGLGPTISVDDELFDFDETIPGQLDYTPPISSTPFPSTNTSLPSSEPLKSPLFAPPLSPFRRRSMEKYHLPGEDESDPFDEVPISSHTKSHTNGFLRNSPPISESTDDANKPDTEDEELLSSSLGTKAIAITPPSKSFLNEGLGIDTDEEDEDGIRGLVERISLKNTKSGSLGNYNDARMLWDIPGDYYRSVPS